MSKEKREARCALTPLAFTTCLRRGGTPLPYPNSRFPFGISVER